MASCNTVFQHLVVCPLSPFPPPFLAALLPPINQVPRFSTASVEQLKQELLQVDYKSLLTEDLMANEVGVSSGGRGGAGAGVLMLVHCMSSLTEHIMANDVGFHVGGGTAGGGEGGTDPASLHAIADSGSRRRGREGWFLWGCAG